MLSYFYSNQTVTELKEGSDSSSSWAESISSAMHTVYDYGVYPTASAVHYLGTFALNGLKFTMSHGNQLLYSLKIYKNARHKVYDINPTDLRAQLASTSNQATNLNQALVKFCINIAGKHVFLEKLNQQDQKIIKTLAHQLKLTPSLPLSNLNDDELQCIAHAYNQFSEDLNQHELDLGTIDYHCNDYKTNLAKNILAGSAYASWAPTLFTFGQGIQQGIKYSYNGQPIHAQETFLNYTKQAVFSVIPLLLWNQILGSPGLLGLISLQIISQTKWYNKVWDPKKAFSQEKYKLLADYYNQMIAGELSDTQSIKQKLSEDYSLDVQDFELLALVFDIPITNLKNQIFVFAMQGLKSANNEQARKPYLEILLTHFNLDFTKPYTVTAMLKQLAKQQKNHEVHALLQEIAIELSTLQDDTQEFEELFNDIDVSATPVVTQYQNTKKSETEKNNSNECTIDIKIIYTRNRSYFGCC